VKKIIIAVFLLSGALLIIGNDADLFQEKSPSPKAAAPAVSRQISGVVHKGETLSDIFKRYHLDLATLFKLREASADVHELRRLRPDRPYRISFDSKDRLCLFTYWIDDDTMLTIRETPEGYCATKKPIPYEERTVCLGGAIRDNLVSSVEAAGGNLPLALKISDIFAWDIDFNTDLRTGDEYKIVVKGLYLNGKFRKYGEVLSAEFSNDGHLYRAYRFEQGGRAGYFDEHGMSLKKAFLKAPLSFRRISSYFSGRRMHPILKIRRPHYGVDYAAPYGTPVSAACDGTVVFAGWRGGYGRLIEVHHPNGYTTFYGHLSRIARGVSVGKRIAQGDVIGYVGATGLATGPHLHYEMRLHGRPLNPLTAPLPKGQPVPAALKADFLAVRRSMDTQLAAISPQTFASAGKITDNRL
jgi:murein DD-endopeptidase MepM/ murein hydrolase activator NlpD